MADKAPIEDVRIRLIMIPFFGIVIPNISGLFGNLGINSPWYWTGYIYFILLSFAIWHGNRWLLFKQREHFNWFNNPYRKIMILVAANVFYTAPLTYAWLYAWYKIAPFRSVDFSVIYLVTLMNVIAVIFITHVYETVFLIKERENDIMEVEKLKRAKIEFELEALKSQIDPHFLFNALNTLSYLIENNSDGAMKFNEALSDVYRYVLMNKNRELVKLEDEIDFVKNYFSLLEIRFGESINLNIMTSNNISRYLIAPISLQLLLENAVKHNEFDDENPLNVTITQKDMIISVGNNISPKELLKPTSQIGLRNLQERYKLITEKEIDVFSTDHIFKVSLPILTSDTV